MEAVEEDDLRDDLRGLPFESMIGVEPVLLSEGRGARGFAVEGERGGVTLGVIKKGDWEVATGCCMGGVEGEGERGLERGKGTPEEWGRCTVKLVVLTDKRKLVLGFSKGGVGS